MHGVFHGGWKQWLLGKWNLWRILAVFMDEIVFRGKLEITKIPREPKDRRCLSQALDCAYPAGVVSFNLQSRLRDRKSKDRKYLKR